jgi:hypothetical protein
MSAKPPTGDHGDRNRGVANCAAYPVTVQRIWHGDRTRLEIDRDHPLVLGFGDQSQCEALTAQCMHRGQGPAVEPLQQFVYTCVHLGRRCESGWQLYEAVGIARGDRAASAEQASKNFELFGHRTARSSPSTRPRARTASWTPVCT